MAKFDVSPYNMNRVPTAHGKQGKWPKKIHFQGKHGEFENFVKTQGIWFSQVVNSLILKVKHISIFSAKIPKFLSKLDKSAQSVYICNSHKSCKLARKTCGRTGKTQGI